MAIFRRRTPKGPLLPEESDPNITPRAVTAAAMPMAGPAVKIANRARNHQSNVDWQKQAWYYYDAIGEFRAPLVWIANAVSRADLFATELDPATGKPTGPTDDPIAIQAASQIFGGATKRATLLKVLALCWQVPGEAWIIVAPQGPKKPDKWMVLPPSKVTTKGSGANAAWQYTDPHTGVDTPLGNGALLYRLWNPHPADFAQADSSARPALPICAEIEKCSQTIAAQLNSRIALAPIMLLADELDFPHGDDETSAMALMDEVLSVAETSVQKPGTPSAIVPMGLNAPSEMIASGGAVAFVSPTTEFVQGLDELRDKALDRLYSTIDMPKSAAAGTQNEANHWSAWLVDEDTYKIYIRPFLEAAGDDTTEQWFRHALVAMGKTPEQAARFGIGWDTTDIVARPDDTENLRDLHSRLLISDDYMLTENGIPLDAKPDDVEYTRRLLEKIVIGSPATLSEPGVAQALGMDVTISSGAPEASAAVESPQTGSETRALPSTQGDEPEPEGVPDGLVAAAGVVAVQALRTAGGRLLNTRELKGQYRDTPKEQLHTQIRASDPDTLMRDAVLPTTGLAKAFGVDDQRLRDTVSGYVRILVMSGYPYEEADLRERIMRNVWHRR